MPMPIDLPWLDTQATPITELLTRLANQNSSYHNTKGHQQHATQLDQAFYNLNPDISEQIALRQDLGSCLRFAKRESAPKRVLLVIHYDTVYPPDHPFQSVARIDDHHLRGPGVADAKGGIVKILIAVDGSKASRLAVSEVARWPLVEGATVQILTVVDALHPNPPEGWGISQEYLEEIERTATAKASALSPSRETRISVVVSMFARKPISRPKTVRSSNRLSASSKKVSLKRAP